MMDRSPFISSCYYPTTVMLVDDNINYINSLKLELLNTADIIIKPFNNPEHALDFFISDYKPTIFTERCLTHPEEDQTDHRVIDVDMRAIREEIYNPNRFDQISVIIVDYAMPGINGLEFCRKTRNKYVKKVMLTGEADEHIAIKAFNEGIIDKFIRKNDPSFKATITKAIKELQLRFFQDISEIIVSTLTNDRTRPAVCLDDPVFIDFFQSTCKQLQAREYYLTDSFGSFMFLGFDGTPSWLAIKNAEEMLAWSEIARYAGAQKSIYEPQKQYEKVLYLHLKEDHKNHPSTWTNYLHPAQQLHGREIYYYSLIQNSNAYDIQPQKVLSFKDYLDQG
jgi:CheY-like chemotaxis protein